MSSVTSSPAASRCIVCDTPLQPFIPAISDNRYGCPGVYAIALCPDCGQMATLPPLQEGDLPELYSRYYPRSHMDYAALAREAQRVSRVGAGLRRWLAGTNNQGHYRARPGQNVLDIGSGSCLSMLEMRALGVQAFGIEADPNVAAIAAHFGLTVHVGSIHDQPFPDQSFDLIVLNQVIEHVPDPLALLITVKERLTPKGTVVLSFPNTDSVFARRSGVRWINWHVPYHQHHFNHNSFALLAKRAGYQMTRVRSITPNLWRMLQQRADREEPPTEGRASATWTGDQEPPLHGCLALRVRRRLAAYATRGQALVSGLSNRAYDVCGCGDSLLVELSVRNV